jgi:large subunit ribosomal protein L32e
MTFKRQAWHRKSRLGTSWRRPRGWQSKLRLEKKGHGKRVKVGFRSEAATRGKKNGLDIVRIHNVSELELVDAKSQGVVIANIGMKKKLDVLRAMKEKKLTLLTGDVAETIKALEEKFASRKKASQTRDAEKAAKQKELEKKAEKEEKDAKEEEPVDAEEAAKAEKKEQEKVLTKAK